MSQQAFTTVTLRRLPQGETLQITISGNKSLNILKDKDSGAETPALSSQNPLVLTPKVYGTSGTQADISEASWKMDGAAVPSAVGSYTNQGVLTITSSPIGKVGTSVHPITLLFKAKATLNGHVYDVEKTLVLNCAETSANSYWGAIEASAGTTLDETTGQTVLTPQLYLGTAKVDESKYSVKWYKTAVGSDTLVADTKTLTVTRSMVDTSAHFEAHFYVGDSEVEAEGVSIIDMTDELQLSVEGDTYAQDNGSVSVKVRAYSKKTGAKLNISSVEVVASDTIRQRTYHQDYVSKSIADGIATVTMQEQYWRVPYADQQVKGEWAICGDTASADTKTTNISKATKCEVTLLLGVSVNL